MVLLPEPESFSQQDLSTKEGGWISIIQAGLLLTSSSHITDQLSVACPPLSHV